MKNIILNNQVAISNAIGHRTGGNCKVAINRTTGDVYKSGTDLSEKLDVTRGHLYKCCREKTPCKGNDVRFASHTSEDIEWMAERIRQLVQENESMKADAERGRAIREEEEAAIRAEEKRLEAIAKHEQKHARHKRLYNEHMEKANAYYAKMIDDEAEISKLKKGNAAQC